MVSSLLTALCCNNCTTTTKLIVTTPASSNCRIEAAHIIQQIRQQSGSLDDLLFQSFSRIPEKDHALLQEICYGTLRHYFSLTDTVSQYLKKPFKNKDLDIHCLLLISTYQLLFTRIPDYAVINEAVNATIKMKKKWAKGLVNAVLRNILRSQKNKSELTQSHNDEIAFDHPQWLVQKIRHHWPEDFSQIFEANNHKAPMTLRVNQQLSSRDEYLTRLKEGDIAASATAFSEEGIQLDTPCDVALLPGFDEGHVSVQDEAAQICSQLLTIENTHTVLDACAAPGGKTCHLLESAPRAKLYAIEKESQRLLKIDENLNRLHLQAECYCADASKPGTWPQALQAMQFDRILLDAPCSATGVIRRHPDIKLLRREQDIENLSSLQAALLSNLWPKLKKNGLLLYATCSILKEENDEVLASFLAKADDARLEPIEAGWGVASQYGRQLLPKINSHDGFYYSLLRKD